MSSTSYFILYIISYYLAFAFLHDNCGRQTRHAILLNLLRVHVGIRFDGCCLNTIFYTVSFNIHLSCQNGCRSGRTLRKYGDCDLFISDGRCLNRHFRHRGEGLYWFIGWWCEVAPTAEGNGAQQQSKFFKKCWEKSQGNKQKGFSSERETVGVEKGHSETCWKIFGWCEERQKRIIISMNWRC